MSQSRRKRSTSWIIFIIILVVAFFTNPNELSSHKEAYLESKMKNEANVQNSNSDFDNAVNSLKNLDKVLEANFNNAFVGFDDYYLFSITKVNSDPVGVGLFGFVFIFK